MKIVSKWELEAFARACVTDASRGMEVMSLGEYLVATRKISEGEEFKVEKNLRGACLAGASLKGIDFSGCDLRGASFDFVDLSGMKGIETANLSHVHWCFGEPKLADEEEKAKFRARVKECTDKSMAEQEARSKASDKGFLSGLAVGLVIAIAIIMLPFVLGTGVLSTVAAVVAGVVAVLACGMKGGRAGERAYDFQAERKKKAEIKEQSQGVSTVKELPTPQVLSPVARFIGECRNRVWEGFVSFVTEDRANAAARGQAV